jgi:ABC-type glycerol-3-phosphate transport system substrate-binding protein
MKQLIAAAAAAAITLTACGGGSNGTVHQAAASSAATWSTQQARASYQQIVAKFNQDVTAWNTTPPRTVPVMRDAANRLAEDLRSIQAQLAAGRWPDTVIDDVTNLVSTAGAERSAWLTVAAQSTVAGYQGAIAALTPVADSDRAAAVKVRQDLGLPVK